MSRYPQVPGSKTGGASAMAAEKMAPIAKTFDDQVWNYLSKHGPECPDKLAFAMGKSPLNIRPALSRLKAKGRVEKLDLDQAEGITDLGNKAHKYRVVQN